MCIRDRESAGQNGGGAGLAMMGMGAGALGGMAAPTNQTPFAGAQQGQQQAAPQQDGGAGQAQGGQTQGGQADGSQSGEDPVAKLAQFKQMLDQGLISQEDYDAAKNRALGL